MLKEDEIVVGILFDNGSRTTVILTKEDAEKFMESFKEYHENPARYHKVYRVGNHLIRLDVIVAMIITNPE